MNEPLLKTLEPNKENNLLLKMVKSWIYDWNKTQLIFGFILIGLLALSPLVVKSEYYLSIIILTAFYAYIGYAWNIIGGFTGQLLVGFISFFGVGAYTTIMLLNYYNISPWIGILVSIIPSGILALFMSFLTLRYGLKRDYFALFTIAMMNILGLITRTVDFTGGGMGMWIMYEGESFRQMAFDSKPPYLFIVIVLLIVGLLINYVIYQSKIGKYFIAIREDEMSASAAGVNISQYKTYATVISAVLAGIGGGFYVIYTGYIDATIGFGFNLNIEMLVAPIIGGRGTILGPIIGALLNKPVVELVRGNFSAATAGSTLVIYGLFLVVFILFLPQGITGLIQQLYMRIKRQFVEREKR